MSAKGNIAKENLVKIISNALGEDYIGLYDKKIYAWADDGEGKVQIAISMTMPKNPVEIGAPKMVEGLNNSETNFSATTLSDADKQKVEELKQKLKDAGIYQE